MHFKDNKVLVTGSNGFVGRNLCRALAGKQVIINKSCGASKIEALEAGEFMVDLRSKNPDWSNALQGCKSVVHLASRAHVTNEYAKNSLKEYRKINLEGTVRLAKQALEAGIEKFIFLSSIGVNGAATYGEPFNVNTLPKPHTPYAVSKFEAEKALLDLVKKTNMKLIIIRAPAVYGVNAPGNFKLLERLIMSGIPLPFLSVKNKRSIISIDNLIDFIYLCLNQPLNETKTFLVSDKCDLSTEEIIRVMGKIYGKKTRIFPFPVFLLKILFHILGRPNLSQSLLEDLQIDDMCIQNALSWRPPFQPSAYLES
jgi:nucleoside-diphosphate-sugar epimerase